MIMQKLQKVLMKRLEKLKKSYRDYQNNPYDPEAAHNIRANSRKLRSLLNFLKETFDVTKYQKMNNELKELGLIYGPVREVDILIEFCSQVALDEPDLSDHYRALFDFLHRERLKEMRRTFNKTKMQAAESTLEMVESTIETIHFEGKIDWNRYIKNRLAKKNRRLMDNYQNVDMDDHEAVHEIRKKAKKLRFSAKYLGKSSAVKHKKMAKDAQNIQDAFGMITDANVNARMLAAYAEKTDDKELKALFYKMIEVQRNLLKEQR